MKIPHTSFPWECLEDKKLDAPPRGESVWLIALGVSSGSFYRLTLPLTPTPMTFFLYRLKWFSYSSLCGLEVGGVVIMQQNFIEWLLCFRYSSEYAAAAAKSLQPCPTLCDPIDGSPPGSAIPGILQARTPEWVAMSFSNAGKEKWKGSCSVVSNS